MSEKNEARPFGARDKWGYLFGDFGNDFTFIFASSYLMVFYTKVWGDFCKDRWNSLFSIPLCGCVY